jgi:hypothetical protein
MSSFIPIVGAFYKSFYYFQPIKKNIENTN